MKLTELNSASGSDYQKTALCRMQLVLPHFGVLRHMVFTYHRNGSNRPEAEIREWCPKADFVFTNLHLGYDFDTLFSNMAVRFQTITYPDKREAIMDIQELARHFFRLIQS